MWVFLMMDVNVSVSNDVSVSNEAKRVGSKPQKKAQKFQQLWLCPISQACLPVYLYARCFAYM